MSSVKKGDWLFTCGIIPKQFNNFHNDDPDSFETMEGSHHPVKHCSMGLMSNEYAEFFNKHKLWKLYDKDIEGDELEIYKEKVKKFCKKHNIKFEGI